MSDAIIPTEVLAPGSAGSKEVVLYGPDNVPVPLSGTPIVDNDYPVDTYLNRFRDYPSRGVTPQSLAALHDEMDRGEPWKYIQFCQEAQANDAKIGSVFANRRTSLLGLDYVITPSDGDEAEANDIADFVDSVISEDLLKGLVADLMDCIAKGFAVDWMRWGLVDGFNVPVEFTPIDQRRFLWNSFITEKRVFQNLPLNVAPTETVFRMSAPATTIKDELLIRSFSGSPGEPIQPWTTVRAFYLERNEHPTRAGLMRPISWLYMLKNYGLKDWARFVEMFGIPMRVVTVKQGDFDNPEITAKVRAALREMGVNASGIFPEGSQIQVITPNNMKAVASELINYYDMAIGQCVLGHELSSGAGRGGSGQLGITAALLAADHVTKGDAGMIGRIIRRDVFTPLVGFNRGWDKARKFTPNLSYAFERPLDKGQEATTVSTIAKTFPKMKWSGAYIREKFDIPAPIDEEDAIGGEEVIAMLPGNVAPGKPGESATPGAPGAPANPPEPDDSPDPDGSKMSALGKNAPAPRPFQSTVDELARQGVEKTQAAIAALADPIRNIVRRGVKLGTPALDVAKQIAAAYPDLDTKALQRHVYQQMALARTFGRVARAKN